MHGITIVCGVTLHEMGRYQEALDEKLKAVELDPDNAEYHNSCGVTLHEMGRYQEALDEYKKAIKLDPKRAIYYSHLAQTYKKMDLEKEAAPGGRKGKSAAKQPVKKKIVQILHSELSRYTKSRKVRCLCGFPALCVLFELGACFVVLNYIYLSFLLIHVNIRFNFIGYSGLLIICYQSLKNSCNILISVDHTVNLQILGACLVNNHVIFPYRIFIVCPKADSLRKIWTPFPETSGDFQIYRKVLL